MAVNLYAARDEDQFYYDNLSAEDRARLERILDLKHQSQGDFDPSDLSKEDFKYYKKLDIATKAMVERLAQKRVLELDGQSSTKLMTVQEKLDWEFYQNIHDDERVIIDRIIDIKVEARRRALNDFSAEEQQYSSIAVNQEQIESKLQLRQLSSLESDLIEQKTEGAARLSKNQEAIKPINQISQSTSDIAYAKTRAEDYQKIVSNMEAPLQLHYQQLSPAARNLLQQSVVREFVLTATTLSKRERDGLISELGLKSDPWVRSNSDSDELTLQIRTALVKNLSLISNQENLAVKEIAERELIAQQRILEGQLGQLEEEEVYTRDLQKQLEEYNASQQAANPQLESQIAEAYYTQEQLLLPLLSPKESHYFIALNPGQQLRIDRLATLVQTQTSDYQHPQSGNKQYLSQQYATDQWFYQDLSPEEQKVVDELVVKGWQPNQTYSARQAEFVAALSESDKKRIERMSSDQSKINFEIPEESRLVLSGEDKTLAPEPTASNKERVTQDEKPVNIPPNSQRKQLRISEESQTHSVQQGNKGLNNRANKSSGDDQLGYIGTQIYFDFNQHTLRSEAKTALTELIRFIQSQQKSIKIVIEGHTDNIGTVAQNYQLSMDRSLSTAAFFERATDLVDVTTVSYGEQRPISSNRTAFGRQLNRRVALRVKGIQYYSTLQTFIVRPGVTLQKIADATGLLESDILQWNGLQSKTLNAYQPLRLPMDIDYNSVKNLLYYPEVSRPFTNMINYHMVKSGENLFRLAMKYDTTVEALEDLNNINATELLAGQQIRVK